MIRKGFKMKLYDGMAAEYEKRHNELWPEMKDMIHEHGGRNYSIFLDEETTETICGTSRMGGPAAPCIGGQDCDMMMGI